MPTNQEFEKMIERTAFMFSIAAMLLLPASTVVATDRMRDLNRMAESIFQQDDPDAAGTKLITLDFEASPPKGWFADDAAGFDFGTAQAHDGKGNAWIGGKSGLHSISAWLDIPSYSLCKLEVWIKLSSGFDDGFISVSGSDNEMSQPTRELKLPQLPQVYPSPTDYNSYRFDFNIGPGSVIFLKIGMNGADEKSWERIDDLRAACKPPF
jgi:hypothetical protein